jgi:hypothetical protein
MRSSAWLGRSPPRDSGPSSVSGPRALCCQGCCPATARSARPGPSLCSTRAGASGRRSRTRLAQTPTSEPPSTASVRPRWRRAGAGGRLPCLPAEGRSRAGAWCRQICKSRQGRARVGRLHSGARGGRRAGPAMSSAASSRRRDMHSYALDQTLPSCYGTMVLIARAQGLARTKAAASARSARRAPITLQSLCAEVRTVHAQYRRPGCDNTLSNACEQRATGQYDGRARYLGSP